MCEPIPVLGEVLGKKLCALFGLDPKKVAEIAISCIPGRPATVNVKLWGTEIEGDDLSTLLQSYQLVRKGEEDSDV